MLEATAAPSPAADVYSLGAMLYEAAVGCRYPRSGDAPAPLPPHRSQAIGVLIEWCLKRDPAERPTARQLVDFCARHHPQRAAPASPVLAPPYESPMQC